LIKIHSPGQFEHLPHAVLFDFDNTFYAYGPAHAAGMEATRAKAMSAFSISAEQFDQAFKAARGEIKARLGATASSHNRLLYFQKLLEAIGLGSQVLLALDFEQTYWRSYLVAAQLFPGSMAFLDDLRLAGIPTAVVTDLTAQIQLRKMVYFGLDRHFECVVTSEEIGHDKPHEAMFRLALEKLQPAGAVVWMIGDSAEKDIAGARDAIGAVTIQIEHAHVDAPSTVGPQADATFTDFADLGRLLEKLVAESASASTSQGVAQSGS
jgi:HAD superfamily hydrolase (TIGR01549 family)